MVLFRSREKLEVPEKHGQAKSGWPRWEEGRQAEKGEEQEAAGAANSRIYKQMLGYQQQIQLLPIPRKDGEGKGAQAQPKKQKNNNQ